VTDQPTLATLTEDQLADLYSELNLLRVSSALRTCLFPTCMRQYDVISCMKGDPPPRPEWSGDGWRTLGSAALSGGGHICPEHVDIVTAHIARPVELPNGRWMVACACDWMSRPQTYGGLLRPLWEEHILTAAGTLPAPQTPEEPLERLPLAEHTEATLTDLYDQVEDADHDSRETREAAQAMFKAWDWHRHALGGVTRAICAVNNHLRLSQSSAWIDWADNRYTAYVYAVLLGWGCQEQHDHDDACGGDAALLEVAAKHRWDEFRVKYIREMRAGLAPITDPQPQEEG
jgi:hypothetical protein